nr:flagellar export protein FliJ [uncultured Moellerella sp.]
MKNKSTFLILKNLAAKQTEKAAIQLKQSNERCLQVEIQLKQLIEYHHEYKKQLNQDLNKGLVSATFKNYQSFLLVVEKAIVYQQEQLLIYQTEVSRLQQIWLAKKQKENAFDKLDQRQSAILDARVKKLDQKLMDEFAQRTTYRTS